jgi:glycosyltransferase involved in cell wall biosynthesis
LSNKKFTILTANYNAGRYLDDWASSVLAQKYRPLEVVFVEDKSSDNSLSIIKKISKKFNNNSIEFKLIQSSKKLHCGSAYNLALKNGTGEYFGVLDSDDMLESFACDFIVNMYEENLETAWVYTQYNKYNRKMDRIIKRGFCGCPGKNQSLLSVEKSGKNIYGHWRTFSNRIKSFKNLFGKGQKCCVDKHLGFRLEELGPGMFVDRVCYRYRTRNSGSIVYSNNLRKVKREVILKAEKRRNKDKIYPVIKGKYKSGY